MNGNSNGIVRPCFVLCTKPNCKGVHGKIMLPHGKIGGHAYTISAGLRILEDLIAEGKISPIEAIFVGLQIRASGMFAA